MVDNTKVTITNAQVLSGHNDRVWSVVWSPQGDLLASCSSDKTIKIWGKGSDGYLECKATLEGAHKKTIRAMCWTPDGSRLLSVGFDSQMCVWVKGEDTFDCVATMEGHENEIKCVVMDSKGEFLATCGRDKAVWVWEKDEGEEWGCSAILNGHSQDVKKVTWVPGTLTIASASYDNTIKFWQQGEDDEWNCIDTLTGHQSTVWDIRFTDDGRFLASCSDDQTIRIWSRNDEFEGKDFYQLICTLEGHHDRPIYSVSWSPDGNLLATTGGDDQINLFGTVNPHSEDSTPSFILMGKKDDAHTNDINCIAFHPNLNIVVTCSDDNSIKIWLLAAE